MYKHGKYEVGRLCVLYRMPVAKQKTRIGFVTGKKVGCAVERNRARRLMKEVYRLNQHQIRYESFASLQAYDIKRIGVLPRTYHAYTQGDIHYCL